MKNINEQDMGPVTFAKQKFEYLKNTEAKDAAPSSSFPGELYHQIKKAKM